MTAPTLSLRALNRATLARQMLLAREKVTPLRAIERLAGLQAQEPMPPFLGLWTRLEGFAAKKLQKLFDDRKIIRATTLRGTLHLHTTKEYLAIRGPLQPMLTRGMKSILRDRAKALDVDQLTKHAARFLGDCGRTFEDIRAHLEKKHPGLDTRAMGYAVRTHLPLAMVPTGDAWSFPKSAEFALAERWLGASIDANDRPHDLVLRYLKAFGPATPADAQTWSGLTGLASVFDELRSKLVVFRGPAGREVFDLPKAPRPDPKTEAPVRLVPAFDNLVLAHADRTRLLADEHRPGVCTKNLRVHPTFLVDGMVAGIWRIDRTKTKARLSLQPFEGVTQRARKELTTEARRLLAFAAPDITSADVEFATAS